MQGTRTGWGSSVPTRFLAYAGLYATCSCPIQDFGQNAVEKLSGLLNFALVVTLGSVS